MKQNYLKSFCARCLTLLVLALLSTNLAWGEDYKLVTSTDDLKEGCKYIIGSGTSGSVKFMKTESNANNRKTTSATVTDSKVTATEDILVLELGVSTDAWTLKTTNYKGTDGYLASASSGGNNYCRVISTVTTATISFSNNAAVINLQPHTERTLLRYNSSSDLFACYSGNQSPVYLYKEESDAPTLNISETTLDFGPRAINSNNELTFELSGSHLTEAASLNISGENAGMFSVSPSTVLLTAGSIETTEVTVSYNPTASGSHSATLTVSSNGAESKEINLSGSVAATHTVTWSINGNTDRTETYAEGANITFPSDIDDINGNTFVGWFGSEYSHASTAPSYVTSAIMGKNDITYYAVFAEKSGGEKSESLDCPEGNISDDKMTFNTTNFTIVHAKGSSSYFAKYSPWRIYQNNTVTVSSETKTISKMEMVTSGTNYGTWTTTAGTVNVASVSGGTTSVTDINAQEVTLTNTGAQGRWSKITIYYDDITYSNFCTTVVTKQLTSITIDGEYPTEFWKGETFSHEGMTVTAHYSNAPDADVTDKAEFTGYDMADAGEQTVTVSYGDKTATYDITVKTIANTQETAYTVTEAKAIIDANPSELATTEVYVKGTVSDVDKIESGAITYWLDSKTFEVYKGKNIDNVAFTSMDQISVGDEVVIYGKIKKFNNSTYEFNEGNYLVSHVKAATLKIDNIIVEMDGEITPVIETNVVGDYTISYTSDNEEVVLADEDEMVTMGLGTATITATLTAEGYKDATTTFTVEVIKALSSIEVKTAPTTVAYKVGDKFDPAGLVITAKYNDETSEDITYSDETKDGFTFEPSLETALTTDVTSVTITYAGKEATQTITVRALYTYDITWMANGAQFTTTQVTEGNALVLPGTTPTTEADGYKFMGWTATEKYFNAETAPTYIVPAEIIPTEAMRFYAVFAKEVEVDGEVSLTINKDTENFPTGYGSSNTFEEKTLNGYIFAIMQAYINGGKLQWRAAGNTNGTGTMYNKDALNKIQSIKLTYHEDDLNKNFTVKVGSVANPTEGTSITPSSSGSVYTFDCSDIEPDYFVLTNGEYAGYLAEINITYIGKTTSYSDYCTIVPRTFTKTISDRKMATLYLDYAVEIPEDVKAYTATDKDDSHTAITLEKITDGIIPANTGVIIYSDIATDYTFTETTDAGSTYESNCLKGVTEKTAFDAVADYDATAYNYYALMAGEGTSVVFKLVSAGSYAANSAYLVLPKTNAAKVEFTFGDEPTGIESLTPALSEGKGVYNLQGVRVNNGYKGIVIMNGKKYINK